MHKFTLFTLIFSIVVVSVVAELVSHNYLQNDLVGNLNSPTQNDLAPVEFSETNPSNQGEEPTENTATPTDPANQTETNPSPSVKITTAILTKAGFTEAVYEPAEFSGKLFELIELAGIDQSGVIKGNIFETKEFAGSLYEIPLATKTADELYQFIKDNAVKLANTTINETNTFGKSFYINSDSKKKTVFLVAQIGSTIYGFEYPHKSHSKVKELIGLLSNTN